MPIIRTNNPSSMSQITLSNFNITATNENDEGSACVTVTLTRNTGDRVDYRLTSKSSNCSALLETRKSQRFAKLQEISPLHEETEGDREVEIYSPFKRMENGEDLNCDLRNKK